MPEADDPIPTNAVHALFPLSGAHSAQNCEVCHVEGAAEQGLTPSNDPEFVTALGLDCLGCHTDTQQQTFPSGHMDGRSCADGGGCHSTSDWCWKQVRTDCGALDDTGIEINHTVEPLSDLFPLDGPHALGCGSCHAGDEANERGGAKFCDNCHEADRPAGHYPPQRVGAESKERGCKACHAGENANRQLVVPASWAANASVHDFHWPHAVVEDWDVNPQALRSPDDWTTSCDGCHVTAQYGSYTCSEACHTRAEINPLSSLHENVTYSECADCHAHGTTN
ncbi:MAG: hypothetical protein H6737_09930 [Alphaproteobacteria bacterium]|nr:hypothetical protein [Alphaproteobacteria bacterium]